MRKIVDYFAWMVEGLLSGPRRGKVRRLESTMLSQPGADGDKGFWGQMFLRTSLDAVTIVCLWEVVELPVASVLSYIKRNKRSFVVKNRCDNLARRLKYDKHSTKRDYFSPFINRAESIGDVQ